MQLFSGYIFYIYFFIFVGKELPCGEMAEIQVSSGYLCAGVCVAGLEGAACVYFKAWNCLLQHQRWNWRQSSKVMMP